MFRRKQRALSLTYLFLENGPFLWPYKITKHYRNMGFQQAQGKPKMALLLAKVPFWEGASKGLYYLWYTKLCSAENTIKSKTQLCRNKECQLKKTDIYPKNRRLFPNIQRDVFVWSVVWVFGVFFFFLCAFFCFVKRPKKVIFLQF